MGYCGLNEVKHLAALKQDFPGGTGSLRSQ
jgi:hypothetical protein